MFSDISILSYLLVDLSCNIKHFGRREQRKDHFVITAATLQTSPHKNEESHPDQVLSPWPMTKKPHNSHKLNLAGRVEKKKRVPSIFLLC